MKRTPEQMIKKLMYEFVNDNFEEIDLVKCSIEGYTKTKLLREVRRDINAALWVLLEVCNWGMKEDREYLSAIFRATPEEEDFYVIYLEGKYIKIEGLGTESRYKLYFVEPKYKTVMYWE